MGRKAKTRSTKHTQNIIYVAKYTTEGNAYRAEGITLRLIILAARPPGSAVQGKVNPKSHSLPISNLESVGFLIRSSGGGFTAHHIPCTPVLGLKCSVCTEQVHSRALRNPWPEW